jgi:hypothetical protein
MEWFVKKSHTDPDYCKNLKIVFSFFFLHLVDLIENPA